MKTKCFRQEEIKKAAELIQEGKLVAFPTETVYGLGADATNPEAVKKVYQAKGRPSDNPLIVHVSSIEMVETYATSISPIAYQLMTHFWPGPLTLIFPTHPERPLSKVVTGGLDTVAFRMPDNDITLQLIKESATPLVGPSANTSGKPSPTTAQHVLHDLDGRIDGVIDGGRCQIGIESTVVDMTQQDVITILRPGMITQDQLMEQTNVPVVFDTHLVEKDVAPKAPGMKYQHYSPETPVMMVDGGSHEWDRAIHTFHAQGKKVGLLLNKQSQKELAETSDRYYELSETRDIFQATAHLFDGLRYLDSEGDLDIILVETYPEENEGVGFMNRLKKAANHQWFCMNGEGFDGNVLQ